MRKKKTLVKYNKKGHSNGILKWFFMLSRSKLVLTLTDAVKG